MRHRLHHRAARAAAAVLAALPAALAAGQQTRPIRLRSQIDRKYLWATENIFPNAESWEQEFQALAGELPELAALKGTLADGPQALLRALRRRDGFEPRLEKVYVYASLLADQDTRDARHQAMQSRAYSLLMRYRQTMSWFEPELTRLSWETLESWMARNADLGLYRQYLHNLLRRKAHILSPREEELLALAGEVRATPEKAYTLLKNADIQFPPIEDEQGNRVELDDQAFYKYMRSGERRVRKEAYEAIVGTYARYRNTAAALLNGQVQDHILRVKARGYENCLAAALDVNNIPAEVYHNLIREVNDNLPLLHRYQQLRRRALKLSDGVHAYDLFAPFVAGATPEYSYEQAVEIVLEALRPLGPEYIAALKKGFGSRWVDVYPTKGKRSGAYSSGSYLTQPYVLMNFHGGFDDLSTLAHEMGHSLHSYFTRANQPYVYGDYAIFCAEVASTCNEILLQNYILARTRDPEQKLYLLVEFLEGFRGTVFRQAMFSEFEQRIHEMAEAGQPLTAESLDRLYGRIMKRYYGPAYKHDKLVDSYWIRIPHFYYNFYVYKYATSYCAASAIAQRIVNNQPGAVEAYLTFLKAGSSRYPLELLRLAGVDMTSPEPIQAAMKLFANMLDQTATLLARL